MLEKSRQINDGEDADPDDIQEMPKQTQPAEAGGDEWVQSAQRYLASQEDDPEHADADVNAGCRPT